MQLEINKESLPVYEALASEVRLHIIQLLSKNKLNIKELSEALGISSPIVTKHVKKLEVAGIIRTEKIPGKSGLQRISILKVDCIEINFPAKISQSYATYETSVPVGHFTNYHVVPTCGIATTEDIVGTLDDPRFFMDPKRVDARILWFTQGFIEYKSPNFLREEDELQQIEISLELASEAPLSNDNWPSDITFSLNGLELGTWVSPGDYADKRGKFTPDWWPPIINQYGLLKTLRITSHGTYMDDELLSKMTIHDINTESDVWNLKMEVKEDASNIGGVTIFGREFGNHNQDILFKIYYL
ncbi:ArsR/SmtB family transcription factor [Gracilibacillus marinus]|uniref:ArsR/SmtB family transcription factor n=1 Tax=Gracilibacillus marinus TaxID=630535 RepID=A0ABV8VU68_9BACI